MKELKESIEIKIKSADVRAAIELFLNQNQYNSGELSVKSLRKTRSRTWFAVVMVESK